MPTYAVTRWLFRWPLLASLMVGIVVGLFAASPAHAATPAQVDDAIKKAKAYLRSQQKPDGSWPETTENQFGGVTSIATYALLAAGDSPQEEHIQKAVKWLGNAKITGIYALGLRAQVWPYLKMNTDVRAARDRDAKLLLAAADKDGRFAYQTSGGFFHNSTTQYGVLGLWACARTGFEVPTKFWQASEQGWWACQDPKTGGWAYRSVVPIPGMGGAEGVQGQSQVRATMTAAGVASLFVAQDYLRASEGLKCNGNITNPRIEAGMKWMADHFNPNSTDGYLLYGIERIGVASGYKYFGKHDWYEAGSNALVKSQAKDGSWPSHGKIPGTAFGIFFLTRGRAPVVMNKLEYSFEAPKGKKPTDKDIASWNQRPRDVANVVRWMGEIMERDLNWQVVNLSVGANDLLDAPLLYMSGDQVLRLSAEDKQKLKSYVEQGGIILGQADCGKAPFSTSFRELGRELFPGYDFRQLPKSHVIFTEQFDANRWKGGGIAIEGLSNGVRELMLLIPREDVARSWQIRETASKRHHFELATNIFLYAVDKSNLRTKGETYIVKPDPKAAPRRTIKVARLQYDGNWNPEPGGWPRLGAILLNQFKLQLQVDPVLLGGKEIASAEIVAAANGKPRNASPTNAKKKDAATEKPAPEVKNSLDGYTVAHWTGTGKVQLDDAARQHIRKFIEAGGTLLIDAAGGSTAFADSAEAELAKMFKSEAPQLAKPLPSEHDLYTLPVSKLSDVGYRNFARERVGAMRGPRVRGIALNNRTAIFFSREDITTGLVGQSVDGVYGYDPQSAVRLATNVLLYATGEGKAPPPAPKPPAPPAKL